MSVSASITVAQTWVPQGAPDVVTIVFSGTALQTIATVGWLAHPPYWSSIESLIGAMCVNGAGGRLQFEARFESAGNLYDAAHDLITQSVQPYFVMSDGTVVVPASVSDLPPVSPAYHVGMNPPTVVAVPTLTANIYLPCGLNLNDINNAPNWLALGN